MSKRSTKKIAGFREGCRGRGPHYRNMCRSSTWNAAAGEVPPNSSGVGVALLPVSLSCGDCPLAVSCSFPTSTVVT